jgi:hypothetical protein
LHMRRRMQFVRVGNSVLIIRRHRDLFFNV